MARQFVKGDSEVAANFHTFIKLRDSKKSEEQNKYEAYLRTAKVLVVAQINGEKKYAPSRFVGYQSNTLEAYETEYRNGTDTNRELVINN